MIQPVGLDEIGEGPEIKALEFSVAHRFEENMKRFRVFMWQLVPQVLAHAPNATFHFQLFELGHEADKTFPIEGRVSLAERVGHTLQERFAEEMLQSRFVFRGPRSQKQIFS